MPISRSGAVSPMALATPRMVPVMMPGMASGRTWWNTACWCEAPTPSAASRIEGGTALIAARDAMMMVGRLISAITMPPTSGHRARHAEEAEEDRKSQQAEDDRRHGRQIVDVDLDDLGQPVLGRELLEVDRSRDADGKRQGDGHEDHHQRAHDGAEDARLLGLARVAVEEEVPGDLPLEAAPVADHLEPDGLAVGDLALAFGQRRNSGPATGLPRFRRRRRAPRSPPRGQTCPRARS